ncbi:MAG: hypothetical protein OXG50_10070, partial [bacterium]|nr:hypothetical protein [bacterium]
FDGTDQPVIGIDIRDMTVDEMRVGMRMRCIWRDPEERSVEDIDNRYGNIPEAVYARFEPTGEPDVPADQLKEHSW